MIRRPPPVRTKVTWFGAAGCVLLVLIALCMPVGVIAYWLGRGSAGVDLGGLGPAALHSLQASAGAGVVAVFAAWPVAFLSVRHPSIVTRAIERLTFVGYALPGLVVALSFVYLGIRLVPALYQTLTMLVFAYVVLFLPQATGALRASLLQVPPSLDDATRSLGARRSASFWRVTFPMVRPGFAAGFALVCLTAMKELPATLLLAPTGYATLATRVWSATSAAAYDRAALAALCLVALACVPLAVLVIKDRDGRRTG